MGYYINDMEGIHMTSGQYYVYKGDALFYTFSDYEQYIQWFTGCVKPLGLGTRYMFSKQRKTGRKSYAVDIYLRLVTEPGRGGSIESVS